MIKKFNLDSKDSKFYKNISKNNKVYKINFK